MKKKIITYCCSLLILLSQTAYASVVLERTRVIYPADKARVALQLVNQSEDAALVQSWIDEGDIQSTPETTTAPFVVIPPITKIAAQGGVQLKIEQLKNTLPQDRESVFYLNVIDIAPKPKNETNQSRLQFALQTRIKLFYRPASLEKATKNIAQQIKITKQGNQFVITNPTAYFFTISKIYTDNHEQQPLTNAVMIAPFSSQQVEYQNSNLLKQNITVLYIDDDGNFLEDKKIIN